MSSSPKTPPGPGSSPPATACGSSASARGKELSPSRPTTRRRAHVWTDEERELVADRIPTQIVGSPQEVVEQLERLVRVTGADELAVTTMTHDHADRVRSYELLADHWGCS